MKIGLRTVKTAISATLASIVAQSLGLLYPTSAGIIAILSVANTKKTSIYTGFYRLISLAIATVIAFICFSIIGFNAIAFGIYLLLFIPVAVYFKLSDGIVVSSVLVTHYWIENTLSWQIIQNEFLLMVIGVGFALVVNSYMPNIEQRLKEDQQLIEEMFREILTRMAEYLNQEQQEFQLISQCDELKSIINKSEQWAKEHTENQLVSPDYYYIEYFTMRKIQRSLLTEMLMILQKISVESEQVTNIRQLLELTATTFSESNDGTVILNKIDFVYKEYKEKELPKSRAEFENRANLFQFLQIFQAFIEIKSEFSKQQYKN
ncbi:aromatic acid exporter family protein [Enterococcus sp. LJL99]